MSQVMGGGICIQVGLVPAMGAKAKKRFLDRKVGHFYGGMGLAVDSGPARGRDHDGLLMETLGINDGFYQDAP